MWALYVTIEVNSWIWNLFKTKPYCFIWQFKYQNISIYFFCPKKKESADTNMMFNLQPKLSYMFEKQESIVVLDKENTTKIWISMSMFSCFMKGKLGFQSFIIFAHFQAFTAAPPIALGLFDRFCCSETMMKNPLLYKDSQQGTLFNVKVCFHYVIWINDNDIKNGNCPGAPQRNDRITLNDWSVNEKTRTYRISWEMLECSILCQVELYLAYFGILKSEVSLVRFISFKIINATCIDFQKMIFFFCSFSGFGYSMLSTIP